MAINTLYAAESWDKIYKAFETVNFTAFDYETIKLSLLDYLKFYYPENFNDYIESSSFVALVESFAYIAEQLAYRQDMSAHEVFISSAQRKQNILKLAKLISYSATRNLPLRGLVKLTSVSTSEDLRDSQGNSLTNRNIVWNDPNNAFWKEQFFLVMNKIMTRPFGNPLKSFQVDDTVYQMYEVSNNLKNNSFTNGVAAFNVAVAEETFRFELVPADVDAGGVFERTPSTTSNFSILYSDDGYGDASDTCGFMMYIKQGQLNKLPYNFDVALQNRMLDINLNNINNSDVWIQRIDPTTEEILESWTQIENVNSQNIFFNVSNERKKFEVETLENDQVRLLFGDGDFADIPVGYFNIWVRNSANRNDLIVQKSKVVDNVLTFGYKSRIGTSESTTFRYSLTTTLDNGAASEDIEHIRNYAPTTYYSQNRMVNGQDYNTFLLKEPTILRLKSVNRTFSGQPKYIRWNDPSGQYQNVKIFGNDLRLYQNFTTVSQKETRSARTLIDSVLEPLLASPGVINTISYQLANMNSPFNKIYIKPRTKFIEDKDVFFDDNATEAIQEKSRIQAALDRHWYGEPESIIYYPTTLNVNDSTNSSVAKKTFAVVDNDTDHLIYDPNIELVKKNLGINVTGFDPANYPYVRVNETPMNTSGVQESTNRFKRFGIRLITGRQIAGDPHGLSQLTIFSSAIEEFISVQVISPEGTLLVYGSVSGILSAGKVDTAYVDSKFSFTVINDATNPYQVGDAFVFEIKYDENGVAQKYGSISSTNIAGKFEVIEESLITDSVITSEFDPTSYSKSWIMIVERVEDTSGEFLYWNVITRNLSLVAESQSTKFWYNSQMNISDSDTKKKIRDIISVLKSNLNKNKTFAVGVNQVYDVVSDVKFSDGSPNNNALIVSPTDSANTFFSGDGYPDNPMQFMNFILPTDFVYFEIQAESDNLVPIKSTEYLRNIPEGSWVNDTFGGKYARKPGREALDFLWQHFTPYNHLIDPSVSNIIDIFVLTRGYYVNMLNFINGITNIAPTPPSSLELRNSYRQLLTNKMISDSVVMHSGKLKLLFGNLAAPELRASFKVIKSKDSKITNDQLKIRILDIIDEYFTIENWDFGQSFYVTELIAVIHKQLPLDIDTVVVVPTFPINYFGDLFVIEAGEDEILHAAAAISDVQIVETLDKVSMKQKS
jgi:hypothetical protein